jgi:hypothetical protein
MAQVSVGDGFRGNASPLQCALRAMRISSPVGPGGSVRARHSQRGLPIAECSAMAQVSVGDSGMQGRGIPSEACTMRYSPPTTACIPATIGYNGHGEIVHV